VNSDKMMLLLLALLEHHNTAVSSALSATTTRKGTLMIETALLAAALHLSTSETTGVTSSGSTANGRELSLQQPSRGAYSQSLRAAATVPAKDKRWAQCVLTRESGGVLHNKQSRETARNPTSSAAGRWQFLQAWQHGGSFMVKDRLVKFGIPVAEAKQVRKYLGTTPIHKWDGIWQDVLFNEVIARGGKHHWNGGSHSC